MTDGYSIFPSPLDADENGVLGFSRTLNCEMLIDAYTHGIFPWPCEETTVLWCSPKMRGVLPLDQVHIPKRLKRDMKTFEYEFRVDTAFDEVIEACAKTPRPGQDGTWITPKIIAAYRKFHCLGYAHSFEAFNAKNELAGGMYGVSIGQIFCGESMFFHESGASKFALFHALELLSLHGVKLFDTQMVTPTTQLFGAREIPVAEYLALLEKYRGAPLKLNF